MNTKRSLLLLAFFGLWISSLNAQTDTSWRNGKAVNDVYDHNWSFGLGVNIVDDSGTRLGGITNPAERWNFSMPLALNAEYYLNNKLSFNAMFTLNKYKEGKLIDDMAYILEGHEASYFAFDLATKLYFRDWIKTYKFDPYIFAGFGYTSIGDYKAEPTIYPPYPDYIEVDGDGNFVVPAIGRMTLNAGIGFNVWFSQTWGLNLNIASKWGMGNGDYKAGSALGTSNQMQYALGAIYFLN